LRRRLVNASLTLPPSSTRCSTSAVRQSPRLGRGLELSVCTLIQPAWGTGPSHEQLATFQQNDFQIIDPRVSKHGLRQFPLPRPDAFVPVLQDALLWTFTSSPMRQMEGGRLRPGFGAEHPIRSVPFLHSVNGVLGYRKAPAWRQFPRGVAPSTQFPSRG
jgi:hypothetical protein